MTADSIRTRIQQVLSTTTLADPRDIANEVLATSSYDERAEWFAECLPEVVRNLMGAERNAALNQATSGRRPRKPNGSPKVDQIRNWWTEFTASRIAVGDSWKTMGDCTVDDLATVIETRRDQAARITAQAEKYETLLSYMREYAVTRVADLPADVMLGSSLHEVAA